MTLREDGHTQMAMNDEGLAPIPHEARPYQGRRAGFVTRMAAAAIDGTVVILLLFAGYVALAVLLFLLDPRGFTFPDVGLIFTGIAGFCVLVSYQTLGWWLVGRTYGSLVMGLRVVNFRGGRLHFVGAFLRAFFSTAFPIGILWVIVSRENRALWDTALRTSVIYDWQPKAVRAGRSPDEPTGGAASEGG